nr:hypothetical protein OG781_42495 [Streptomyces sp. NBC_00830]
MTYIPTIPTFADFIETDWSRDFPGESDPLAQWAVYADRVHRGVQILLRDPVVMAAKAEAMVSEELAKELLAAIFGAEWVEKQFPLADQRESGDLSWVWPAHQRRELARRVFEFQSHPWFKDFVTYTRTAEVASAIFEADVLQTLMRMPAGVARVTESGIKGQDFDGLLHVAEVGHIPIEVKYKQDDTPYSTSTIRSTIKGAVKQLPKGQVGWLFLHIPTAWVGPRLEEEYAETLDEALRQTSRVSHVFTAIDKPSLDETRGKIRIHRVWDFYGKPDVPQKLSSYRT